MKLVKLTATFFDGAGWKRVTVEITTLNEETAIELLEKEIKCIKLHNATIADFEAANIPLVEQSMWTNRDWQLACSDLKKWVQYDIETVSLPLINYV